MCNILRFPFALFILCLVSAALSDTEIIRTSTKTYVEDIGVVHQVRTAAAKLKWPVLSVPGDISMVNVTPSVCTERASAWKDCHPLEIHYNSEKQSSNSQWRNGIHWFTLDFDPVNAKVKVEGNRMHKIWDTLVQNSPKWIRTILENGLDGVEVRVSYPATPPSRYQINVYTIQEFRDQISSPSSSDYYLLPHFNIKPKPSNIPNVGRGKVQTRLRFIKITLLYDGVSVLEQSKTESFNYDLVIDPLIFHTIQFTVIPMIGVLLLVITISLVTVVPMIFRILETSVNEKKKIE